MKKQRKYDLPIEENAIKVPRFEESAGFYTTKQRSKTMAKIKGANSKPELLLRKALWKENIRFRIHRKDLLGRPDLVIEKYQLAIFIDGDFWHGYEWQKRKPKTNQAFWIPKIERNMQRDQFVNHGLQAMGYVVMRFWEHEIKQNLMVCVNQIKLYIEAAKKGRIPERD
ncbi:very short patch repair endonuclease [Pedobacter xixiisoli]|uniref:T/G mismatch-specific endonuclease n=1 Tax=Pedobacter xixiisoli TaxID=1476464 RepID=A0A285ZY37_9SPHI|nr:very short patch repair endonuclease [Pedobacter xixiisoli]SOD14527.1 T/G mismatch-specific endonuclease [Pedobacter xixiisoli]